jgi:hypothetical protein
VVLVELMLVTDPSQRPELAGTFARPRVSLEGVDWNVEAAVVVDLGERRTAGFKATVADLRQAPAGEIELVLDVTEPHRGDFVAQVITHPYTVARVPRAWVQKGENTLVARDRHGKELARQVVHV